MSTGTGQRSFRKTGGDFHETWNPRADESNQFHFKPDDDANNVMEGYLIGLNEGVGQHSSTVWHLHEVTSDGKMGDKWSIWGDKVLNGELYKEKIGSYVRIVYKGKKAPKGKPELRREQWTKGNSYHIWEVLVDDNAIPYDQASPGSTLKPATPAQNQNSNQGAAQQNNSAASAQPAFNSRNRGNGNNAGANNSSGGGNNSAFAEDDLPF